MGTSYEAAIVATGAAPVPPAIAAPDVFAPGVALIEQAWMTLVLDRIHGAWKIRAWISAGAAPRPAQ